MKTEGKKVELTIDQVEMICNKYCRMPYQIGNQELLEDICLYCPINGGMGPAEEGCPELPESEISLKIENESESLLKTCNQTCLKTCKVASNDCISREAAIDIVAPYDDEREMRDALEDLPPAQPEPIRINLNEPIKVKLTDWGKEIYYHQYDRTNQIAGREICKPRFPREDENGYTEFQLWCFIELYGMHMGMTLPNVIEPLEIVYER